MTTRRDNLRNVLRGRKPQWIPFALNFNQWFTHHRKFNMLPAELAHCGDYIDAMKALGCDIFSRNVDGGLNQVDTKLNAVHTQSDAATGPRTVTVYDTPHGQLRRVIQAQSAITASHTEEYWVKDWQKDGDALQYLLAQKRFDWNEDVFAKTRDRIGEDGILNVPGPTTPLKMLHNHFGLDYSCLFLMDEPAAAKRLCNDYWAQVRPILERMAKHPDVESVCLMDNVDTPFYPPVIAAEYWAPYVKDATDLMRRNGKYLFVHACGQLAGLAEVFAWTGVSGLEGISHPPLGDWPVSKAQRCHEQFIFIGGFGAHEQETMNDAQVRAFYDKYLATARKERFIFSSSCQTAVGTTWARIKLVRDIVRAWGGVPEGSVLV